MTGILQGGRLLEHLETVDVGQAEVEEDQVDGAGLEQTEGLRAGGRGEDRVPGPLEVATEEFANVAFVLDDEHRGHVPSPAARDIHSRP